MTRRFQCLPGIILFLSLLSACGTSFNASVPTTVPPTSAVIASVSVPTNVPPTAAPPTDIPPTSTSAPVATTQPTLAPTPTTPTRFLVFPTSDGGLARLDGPGETPLILADPTAENVSLPWAASPDGRTIAVVTGKGLWGESETKPQLALWFVNSDATNPRKIQNLLPTRELDMTPGGEDGFDLIPALIDYQKLEWSPDGSQVVFVSDHENQVDVYTAALDGSITRLSNTPEMEQGPVWSPDGVRVAMRTTSSFGTGAGWGNVGFSVVGRAGGTVFAPALGKLKAGTEALGIPDLLWIGDNDLVIGLWDREIGNAEVRRYSIGGQPNAIFAAPYSALAWNATTQQLAIAGTEAQLVQQPYGNRTPAPGLYIWRPSAGGIDQITDILIERVSWAPSGDALAYSGASTTPESGTFIKETTITHIGPSTRTLLWSPDGAQLATDTAVYHRDGTDATARPQQGTPVAWFLSGLCLYANGEVRFWDGTNTQLLAPSSRGLEDARVVQLN